MKKLLTCILALGLMLTSPVMAETEAPAEGGLSKDLVILYTSDVHCGVDQGFGYVGLKAVL